MTSLRPILVSLAICFVALAQQLCCCLVAPTVNSLLAADSAAAHGHCCNHDSHDEAPADRHGDQDSLPSPHECECRLGRSIVQIEAKVRLFADSDNDPGVPQMDTAAAVLTVVWRTDPFAVPARAGPSPGSAAGPSGPPATPLALRVLLTV